MGYTSLQQPPLILHAWGGRHASAAGRQAGKSPRYRPILRLCAQRVFSFCRLTALLAVPSTRPDLQTAHHNAVPSTRLYLDVHRTPCLARARTRTPPRCRAQHAPVPQRVPHGVLSTRPHPQTTSPLPRTSIRQGVLSRDPGPQVHLIRRHSN